MSENQMVQITLEDYLSIINTLEHALTMTNTGNQFNALFVVGWVRGDIENSIKFLKRYQDQS